MINIYIFPSVQKSFGQHVWFISTFCTSAQKKKVYMTLQGNDKGKNKNHLQGTPQLHLLSGD